MTVQEDMMRNYPPSLAATKKLGGIADGFLFYEFEWLGDKPEEWTVMKCSGAVFREAKTGPRKGQRCIKVSGTERTAFVTDAEIQAEAPNVGLQRADKAQLWPVRWKDWLGACAIAGQPFCALEDATNHQTEFQPRA